MIQVCSRCGTRWNVRDRQRAWCPRCHGTLLAPASPPAPQSASRLPTGFRWIAVRPGPPPPPRRSRRAPGPTPRYYAIPRWGLYQQVAAPPVGENVAERHTSPGSVRTTLTVTAVVLAFAAAAHVLRYLLMLVNRTALLPPFVAVGSLIVGALASLAAIVAVIVAAVVSTAWLVGRRKSAFAVHGQDDPRSELALWVGCLVPVVNWFYAPLFALELAQAEGCRERQNRPVALWAIGWIVATLICAWATWTGLRAKELQAAADNTVTTIAAYLAGLAVIILLWRVFEGFVRRPLERPVQRWVIVPVEPTVGASPATENPVTDVADEAVVDEAADSRDREPVA